MGTRDIHVAVLERFLSASSLQLPALRGMPQHLQTLFAKLYKDPKWIKLKKAEQEASDAEGDAEDSGDIDAMNKADEAGRQARDKLRAYENQAAAKAGLGNRWR